MENQLALLKCTMCSKLGTSLRTKWWKKIWCQECLNSSKKIDENPKWCSNCTFTAEKDPLIEKLLEGVHNICIHCNNSYSLIDYNDHLKEWGKEIKCKIWDINLKYFQLSDHVRKNHLELFNHTFMKEERKIKEELKTTTKSALDEEIVIDFTKNDRGFPVTKNKNNQKYYWGQEINHDYDGNMRYLPKVWEGKIIFYW